MVYGITVTNAAPGRGFPDRRVENRMEEGKKPLDLLFLGSGNAFGAGGRAFSSFLLNERYLFDAGPTVLQQLKQAMVPSTVIDAVLISHFHADHFFGLPFLFLDLWREGRKDDLVIVGPPGIEERSEMLLELAFPRVPSMMTSYKRRYIEVRDGVEAEAMGLEFTAAEVDHVPDLQCFAYRAHLNDRTLMYSGDSKLCPGLLRLVPGADTLILECSCSSDPVHMSTEDVLEVVRSASPGATTIITHLDGDDQPDELKKLLIAYDLAHFKL
jgi:ribonuclease Z